MFLQVLLLALAIVVLYFGAEIALEAAERVGRFLGLSPLVVGLLIIGFGTSLPELFVSQLACFHDHSGIAIGNIIGSNIANVFLIMGVTLLFAPLRLNRLAIKHQLILHLILTLILVGILSFNRYYLASSLVLVSFFGFYIYNTLGEMKKNNEMRDVEGSLKSMDVLKLFGGFAFLYFGGELLVNSGSKLAIMFGISDYVISATIVAFGTSFPELVTAMVACYRKKDIDLITGNIIGSNIFNVAFVMGSLGLYQIEFGRTFWVELAILFLISIYLLIMSYRRHLIFRTTGIFFLLIYSGVIIYWAR